MTHLVSSYRMYFACVHFSYWGWPDLILLCSPLDWALEIGVCFCFPYSVLSLQRAEPKCGSLQISPTSSRVVTSIRTRKGHFFLNSFFKKATLGLNHGLARRPKGGAWPPDEVLAEVVPWVLSSGLLSIDRGVRCSRPLFTLRPKWHIPGGCSPLMRAATSWLMSPCRELDAKVYLKQNNQLM